MKAKLILIFILTGFLISCETGTESREYSFSGKAQKGPFITGTNITLNELNAKLGQTGKSFTSSIVSDDGSFMLENIELKSSLALLTANGFYFSEVYGELSNATLNLQAITDLTDKQSVNINILTHLVKGRVETLVKEGKSFSEASLQAKSELLDFFGFTESFETDFDDLDISQDNEYNGVLLAISSLVQRRTNFMDQKQRITAELTELIAKMGIDFQDNGLIDNQTLIDTLLHNVSLLNLTDIRNNIEDRYQYLGMEFDIPDFEKYIGRFQAKHKDTIYIDFYYPANVSPEPEHAPDGFLPNLLVKADTVFKWAPYSVAAIIPLNSSLKIRFIGQNFVIGGGGNGWELINEYPKGFTLIAQRQNELMSMLLHLQYSGEATIEYYENDMNNPTYTKHISWKE